MSEEREDIDKAVEEIQAAIIEDTRKDYSEKVVECWLNPRSFGEMDNPEGFAKLTGPCGDTMQMFIKVNGEKIADACFITDGCGPSVAAGSVATKPAKGRSLEAACNISNDAIEN